MDITDPTLRFRGKAVALTFASTILRPARGRLRERLADLVGRLEATPTGEDAFVLAVPLEAARLALVAEAVARTPELIAFRVRRR